MPLNPAKTLADWRVAIGEFVSTSDRISRSVEWR
jgi:hypothetical protein